MNSLIKLTLIAASMMVSNIAQSADAPKKYIGDANDKRPFSQAVLAGNTLYVAGTLGLDPKTGQAPADAKVEIKNVLDSVKQAVESAGFKMDDLVNVQIFCTDLALYDSFNEIYRTYFHGRFPARAFVGTDKLLRGAHFEVMGIAVKAQ